MNAETPEAPLPQPETPVSPPQPARSSHERPRPRSGPIFWGAIVLAFCAFSATQLLAPGAIDGTAFVIATVIAIGTLLLAVGLVVIVRNSNRARASGATNRP